MKNLTAYDGISHAAWQHSIHVAAIARVLARRLGRINPDEAMLAGLVHDVGIFICSIGQPISRVSQRPARHARTARGLAPKHRRQPAAHPRHAGGDSTDAVRDHEHIEHTETPCNVCDVLYFANLLADDDMSWLPGNPLSADRKTSPGE